MGRIDMQQRNLWILSFTLLAVMVGYGLVLPIMPFYIQNLGAGGQELGWLMSTYSLMQLICAPIWGVLSDRWGRKPVLSIGVFGYAVTLLFFGLSTQFWMLFFARTLSGILSSATMPTAMAYIGDNTVEKERSAGMGKLGAAMGIGVVLGPLLGGWLSEYSLQLPFFVGSGMAFFALLLLLILLPESHDRKLVATSTRWNGEYVRGILLSPAGILLLLIFLIAFGLASFQGIIGLYVIQNLAFSASQVGTLWMVMGGVMILVQGALIGPLTRLLGEVRLIRLGMLGSGIGFGLILLAGGYIRLLLAVGFLTLALALVGPSLNARISHYAGDHLGGLMGLNSTAASLGRVIGPLWAGPLFDLEKTYPFFGGMIVLFIGFIVSLVGLREKTVPARYESHPNQV
jgi:DHA1 family multidrug resistance protein-like MFS transporter